MSNSIETTKKITKEEINLLPISTFSGKVNVIIDKKEAVKAALELSKEKILGFDTETRPSFKKGESYPVSMLQLSGEKETYLFRIKYYEMPNELIDLLSNSEIIKTGVAIRDDLVGLQKLRNFEPGGFIELADLAKKKGIKQLGLRSLAGMFLKVRVSKKAKLTNWEQEKLNESQLIYAATDSWIGRELYLVMK